MTHPYGEEWGSCSSCGGDRELASLDAEGRCECCPQVQRARLRALPEGGLFRDGVGDTWRKGKPYGGHRDVFHARRESDGAASCFGGNIEFRLPAPTVDLFDALKIATKGMVLE